MTTMLRELRCDVHLATGRGATAERVTDSPRITINIRYPLSVVVTHAVENRKGFTVRAFSAAVRDAYLVIYKEPKKHGVWGHELDDLHLERISEVGPGEFEIGVGS